MNRGRRLLVGVLLVWPLAAWVAARALIVEDAPARADAIVVLAGSSTYRERAARAAELYRGGRAPFVIVTNDGQRGGWSAAEQRNPFFYEMATVELVRRGVPNESVIVIQEPAFSTYEEVLQVRRLAEEQGLRTLLVVPVAYQSRRARWTLRRVFGEGGPTAYVSPPPAGGETPRPALWWLTARGWVLVPGEYLKLIYYAWKY